MAFLATITALILAGLSALHFYWAFGGRYGWDKAVPYKDAEPLFTPGKAATLLVAVALLLFSGLALLLRWPAAELGAWPRYLGWLLAGIFLLRAVGDFKYCGFFKRLRGTEFAVRDSFFYSPLCLFLSTSFALLAY